MMRVIAVVTLVIMGGLIAGTVFLLRGDAVTWMWFEFSSLGLFVLFVCYVNWAISQVRKDRQPDENERM